MGFHATYDDYPLVNCYSLRTGKIHHAIFMGKLTISMVIFNSELLNYQRVFEEPFHWSYLPFVGWWCNFTILKNDGVRQWEA